MPFDGREDVRARLDILRQLCEANPERRQGNWSSCLWGEAWRDARLRKLGIRELARDGAFSSGAFFGLTWDERQAVFGLAAKPDKLPVILAALARLDGRPQPKAPIDPPRPRAVWAGRASLGAPWLSLRDLDPDLAIAVVRARNCLAA